MGAAKTDRTPAGLQRKIRQDSSGWGNFRAVGGGSSMGACGNKPQRSHGTTRGTASFRQQDSAANSDRTQADGVTSGRWVGGVPWELAAISRNVPMGRLEGRQASGSRTPPQIPTGLKRMG